LNIYNALLATQTYDCTPQSVDANNPVAVGAIFPNPANENVTVTFLSAVAGPGTIVISNMLGQMVSTVAVKAEAGNNFKQVDVSTLPAGVYFVQLSVNGNSSVAKRLVIE
jgi:hypothetical protein